MTTLSKTLKKILVDPPIDTKYFHHYIFVEYLCSDMNAHLLNNIPIDCMERALDFYQPKFRQILSKNTPSRIANAYDIFIKEDKYKETINSHLISVDHALTLLTDINSNNVNLADIFIEKYNKLQEENADCY